MVRWLALIFSRYRIAFALSFLAGAYVLGNVHGANRMKDRTARQVAKVERELAEITNQAVKTEAARLAIERDRDALQEQLDNEAQADPDANRIALPSASMRRLNRIGAAE